MSDLISRQMAIDLFPNDTLEWDTKGGYIAPHLARKMIEELPSAQPERKTGRWNDVTKTGGDFVWKCSECGELNLEDTYYCPNCGAKMEETAEQRWRSKHE